MKAIDNKELILAIEQLCKEKGYEKEYLLEAIELALVAAYKKNYDALENVKVLVNKDTGAMHVYAIKEIVDDVLDPDLEISLEDAKQINPDKKIGEEIDVEIIPKDFGRIAAITAKQVIVQKLREAERDMLFNEFNDKKGEIVTGYIQKVDPKSHVVIDIGKLEAIMVKNGMIPNEQYHVNQKIRAYIEKVDKGLKGIPQVKVSRTNPEFVKKLFEFEIPEIYEGLIEIKAVSREPGMRTKLAVYSPDENIDPVGSCVGPKGIRIQNIINELNGEKIDVIEWNQDPVIFITSSLQPATILAVDIDEEKRFAQVLVPDEQLSLAIGKNGHNVRLAANLTEWKIDIKSDKQFRKMLEEQMQDEENDIDMEDLKQEVENAKQDEISDQKQLV